MNHLMNVYRPAHFGATGDFSEMAARALSTESEPKLAAAVAKQIAAAKFKQNLPDYRQAEDITLFYKNPADIFAASYKAAWWLAVAARTSQVWSLTDLAVKQQELGASGLDGSGGATSLERYKSYWGPVFNVETTATDPAAISKILKSAGASILAVAANNGGAKAAAAALGQLGDTGAIRTQQQVNQDASASGLAAGTMGKNFEDVATIADALRSLGTGNVPRGWTQAQWDAFKMKLYIGGGVLAVGTGVYLFGPAIRSASGRAAAALDASTAREEGRARLIRSLT